MLTIFLYNNASRFLDSLVVYYMQELLSIRERRLPLWVSKKCCPGWGYSLEAATAAVGTEGIGVSGTRKIRRAYSRRAQRISLLNSKKKKKKSKLTKISICLRSFIDPDCHLGSKKSNPQICFNFKMLNSFQICGISFILLFSQCLLDFRQNV